MLSIYLYLTLILIALGFLAYKIINKKKREKRAYEEREENVFYDAASKIRRD